jgi:hypothetical protein
MAAGESNKNLMPQPVGQSSTTAVQDIGSIESAPLLIKALGQG